MRDPWGMSVGAGPEVPIGGASRRSRRALRATARSRGAEERSSLRRPWAWTHGMSVAIIGRKMHAWGGARACWQRRDAPWQTREGEQMAAVPTCGDLTRRDPTVSVTMSRVLVYLEMCWRVEVWRETCEVFTVLHMYT